MIEESTMKIYFESSKNKKLSLSERNLTRAERYNRESNKIFSYKRALDKEMKRYLVDNGVPEDEAEKLFQDDKLYVKLRELGLHDDFFDMWSSRKYGYDKSGEYYYIPESVSKRTSRGNKSRLREDVNEREIGRAIKNTRLLLMDYLNERGNSASVFARSGIEKAIDALGGLMLLFPTKMNEN